LDRSAFAPERRSFEHREVSGVDPRHDVCAAAKVGVHSKLASDILSIRVFWSVANNASSAAACGRTASTGRDAGRRSIPADKIHIAADVLLAIRVEEHRISSGIEVTINIPCRNDCDGLSRFNDVNTIETPSIDDLPESWATRIECR